MALGLNVAQCASTNVHGDHEELNENHHHHHQSLIWIGLLHKVWFILTLKDCNFWEVVFMWLPPQIELSSSSSSRSNTKLKLPITTNIFVYKCEGHLGICKGPIFLPPNEKKHFFHENDSWTLMLLHSMGY